MCGGDFHLAGSNKFGYQLYTSKELNVVNNSTQGKDTLSKSLNNTCTCILNGAPSPAVIAERTFCQLLLYFITEIYFHLIV